MTKTNPKLQALAGRLHASLVHVLVGRHEEAYVLTLAALLQEHAVLIGPPGTGKSALSRALTSAIGARGFSYQLSSYTLPDELFGPVRLSALKQDRFERDPSGRLPEAELSYLDEVFKGSSAVLNALLAALNERTFYNPGPTPMPLRMVVGASNELPKAENGALWDRFLFRTWTDSLRDSDDLLDACQRGARGEGFTLPGQVLDLDDWDAIAEDVRNVEVPETVLGELVILTKTLRAQSEDGSRPGVPISDRRMIRSIAALKAAAYLDGRDRAVAKDLRVLAFTYWTSTADRAAVQAACRDAASPNLRQAEDLYHGMMGGDRAASGSVPQQLARLSALEDQLAELADGDPEILSMVRKVQKAHDKLEDAYRQSRKLARRQRKEDGSHA